MSSLRQADAGHADVPVCGSPYLKKFGRGHAAGGDGASASCLEDRPQTDIIRMDADTTARAMRNERLFRQFEPGPAVLLGTQMIAKGLDFNDLWC